MNTTITYRVGSSTIEATIEDNGARVSIYTPDGSEAGYNALSIWMSTEQLAAFMSITSQALAFTE